MNNKLSTLIKSETKERGDSIGKLEGFLLNPGRFSVLVLGMRGTGKSHWLQQIQKINKTEKYLTGLIIVNAELAKKSNQDFWLEKFKNAENKLLVIEDVEKLSKESQEILFDGLSTGAGAKYGFDDKKIYEFRIAFTSTFDIKTLRDTEEFLTHKFFDRISQFVVKFPSFSDLNHNIWSDFKKTWVKMNFKTHNEVPDYKLRDWLEKHSHELHGNFRDLDKLVINWHNYRLRDKKEEEILSLVTEDFRDLFHFPVHNSDLSDAFHIDRSIGWEGNIDKFKTYFKKWVIVEYGSLKKGAVNVGISNRTMERW